MWWDFDDVVLFGSELDNYEKVIDILDVWFDLGVMYYFVVDCCDDILVFVDLYFEGLD